LLLRAHPVAVLGYHRREFSGKSVYRRTTLGRPSGGSI
jgi:hypothetical protein